MDSILNSVKKFLGISPDDTSFDDNIIICINSVFTSLSQICEGLPKNFNITDKTSVWKDYIEDEELIGAITTYICLKVRLLFDPPASSVIIESTNRIISESEWRIQKLVDG